jgi:hypothetical protein
MLTVMPVVASAGMILFDPERWGGSFSLSNVLMMAVFGVLTVPVWITYLPSLVAVPIVMGKLSSSAMFTSVSLPVLLSIAFFVGAVVGVFILSPVVIMVRESLRLMMNWICAGAISGAITFVIVSLLYRKL